MEYAYGINPNDWSHSGSVYYNKCYNATSKTSPEETVQLLKAHNIPQSLQVTYWHDSENDITIYSNEAPITFKKEVHINDNWDQFISTDAYLNFQVF